MLRASLLLLVVGGCSRAVVDARGDRTGGEQLDHRAFAEASAPDLPRIDGRKGDATVCPITEDFGSTLGAFKAVSGSWSVTGGKARQAQTAGFAVAAADLAIQSYTASVRITIDAKSNNADCCEGAGISVRSSLGGADHCGLTWDCGLLIGHTDGVSWNIAKSAPGSLPLGTEALLRVTVSGSSFTCEAPELGLSLTYPTAASAGGLVLHTGCAAGSFDDVRVCPL